MAIMEDLKAVVLASNTAEGGFKSKLNTPYANQWMTTLNGVIRCGIDEVYGDAGLLKTNTKRNLIVATA
jgi:hypothetical protein